MQGSIITDNTYNSEWPCDEDPCGEYPCDNNSRTCSPFCGQPGCGIVINEVNTQNTWIVVLPELEYKFVYLKNNHQKNIPSIIWHPPKA